MRDAQRPRRPLRTVRPADARRRVRRPPGDRGEQGTVRHCNGRPRERRDRIRGLVYLVLRRLDPKTLRHRLLRPARYRPVGRPHLPDRGRRLLPVGGSADRGRIKLQCCLCRRDGHAVDPPLRRNRPGNRGPGDLSECRRLPVDVAVRGELRDAVRPDLRRRSPRRVGRLDHRRRRRSDVDGARVLGRRRRLVRACARRDAHVLRSTTPLPKGRAGQRRDGVRRARSEARKRASEHHVSAPVRWHRTSSALSRRPPDGRERTDLW